MQEITKMFITRRSKVCKHAGRLNLQVFYIRTLEQYSLFPCWLRYYEQRGIPFRALRVQPTLFVNER
jgi:hypothetical protein